MRGEPLSVRFEQKVNRAPGQGPNGDCHIWTGAQTNGGYGHIWNVDYIDGAHRAAYELAHGVKLQRVRQGGPMVCHTCDVRLCVNPAHLFLGTNTENMQDMIRKGRQVIRDNRGDANPLSKLKPDQVFAIRADGRSYGEIANDFAISVSAISMIKHRKRWNHLTEGVFG